MFARILDSEVKMEKKDEFVKILKNEVLPILKKQTGFLEILPFFPEKMREEKVITISLWATKPDAERYEREFYPKILDIVKPFLTTPVKVNYHKLETTVLSILSRRWPPEKTERRKKETPEPDAPGFLPADNSQPKSARD